MSQEFPFLNDEAEDTWEGNDKYWTKQKEEFVRNNSINFFYYQSALPGSFIGKEESGEHSWDLSSIISYNAEKDINVSVYNTAAHIM